MSLLTEIRDLVKNVSWINFPSEGAGTANAFLMDLPATPPSAVAFYQYGGELPLETMGQGIWAEKPRLQVVVRDAHVEVALARAYELFSLLGNMKHARAGAGRPLIYKVTANSSAFELGPDDAGLQRVVINFQVMKELG